MDKDPLNSIGPPSEEGYQDESDQRDIVDKSSLDTIDYPSSRGLQDEPEGFPAWTRIGEQLSAKPTFNFGIYMMMRRPAASSEPPGAPPRSVPRVRGS
eukprot:13722200-Alexandrium_andersonii.AAC.1